MRMTKRKFKLPPVIIALLCVLLTAVVGVVALAKTGEVGSKPEIIAKNISYSDELYTYYAIPVSGVAEGETVALKIYKPDGVTEKATVTTYSIQDVWGESCYVFRGLGTAPKNIKTTEYVKAVTSDGGESEMVEYSVLEYLFDKLFREGYASVGEDGGKDYTRRTTYFRLLKYAMSAQNLFSPNADPIEDTNYIGILGGANIGFYEDGASFTLDSSIASVPLYKSFINWTVSEYDIYGNLIDSYDAPAGSVISTDGLFSVVANIEKRVPDGLTVIFDDSSVNIVTAKASTHGEYKAAEKIYSALSKIVGQMGSLKISTVVDPTCDVNVILGVNTDPVSEKAFNLLSGERTESFYSEAKYVVYAEDGKIALAYDENIYTAIQSVSYAADLMLESFVGTSDMPIIEDESTEIGTVDLIAEQKELDAVDEANQWAALEAAAIQKYGTTQGKALTDAFRQYYTIRSDELIVWYANLYDPGIGGFYASTSGKEYDGFLPLIETTGQLIGHLQSHDLFKSQGNSSKNGLPEVIKAQVIYFIKSTQDKSSGYFYNPVIPKSQADATVVRRGRDLSRCTSLLTTLGSNPTYDTPAGTKGDGITPDEYWALTGLSDEYKPRVPSSLDDYREYLDSLTTSLGGDSAAAVSLLVADPAVSLMATDSSVADSEAYLKSHAAFDAYLASKDIDTNPYSVGNEINGTYKLIQQFSSNLGVYTSPEGTAEENQPWYEGMTLCDMLLKWLNDHINEKGLFGSIDPDDTDPNKGVKYLNTNGFFKLITIYNALKVAYPKPLLAAQGLLAGIKGDETSTGNICNVYNAWNALTSLISNVNNYKDSTVTDAEREETLSFINTTLATDGPAAVIKSYNKQLPYRCSDGTFSNSVSNSVKNFPGSLPAGLGIKEGNVDAIGFGFYATVNAMYSALGLSSSRVRYYYDYNYMMFLETILNLEPVTDKKGDIVKSPDYKTTFDEFDEEELIRVLNISRGTDYTDTATGEVYKNSYAVITEENGNKALQFNKVHNKTTASTLRHYVTYEEEGANVLVYGARIKVVDVVNIGYLQFSIISSSQSPFMVLLRAASTADGANINVNGGTQGAVKVGDWFDFRIEYRVTARDSEGTPTAFEAKAFINNTNVYTTTSLYGAGRTIYEIDEIDALTFSINQANAGVYLIDDVYTRKIAD